LLLPLTLAWDVGVLNLLTNTKHLDFPNHIFDIFVEDIAICDNLINPLRYYVSAN